MLIELNYITVAIAIISIYMLSIFTSLLKSNNKGEHKNDNSYKQAADKLDEYTHLQRQIRELEDENKELRVQLKRYERHRNKVQADFLSASDLVIELRHMLIRLSGKSPLPLANDLSKKSVTRLLNRCQICFEEDMELPILLPCGHVGICIYCMESATINETCPFCNKAVDYYQSIYLTMDPDEETSESDKTEKESVVDIPKKQVKKKIRRKKPSS